MDSKQTVTVALDATGGDLVNPLSVAKAIRFALVLNPDLRIKVYGSQKINVALASEKIDAKRYDFILAPESIPQDEEPRKVIESYSQCAMRKVIEAVSNHEADVAVSSGGTGPLVTLSRHILGVLDNLRPALCAKIPSGPGKYALMLDLGANAQSKSADLYSFAKLGHCAYKVLFNSSSPRVSVLNVGTERNKGSPLVKEARDLIEKDRLLNCLGFVEANQLFTGETDVIVTDGFTGNVALKAAEGVASIFLNAQGMKKFFSKLARPDWLIPWQYNGSLLLGVDGLVVKSHASAGQEAIAVALVQSYNMAKLHIVESIKNELKIS